MHCADERSAAKALDCHPTRPSPANERNTTEGSPAVAPMTAIAAIAAPKRDGRRRNASTYARDGRREGELIRLPENTIRQFDASPERALHRHHRTPRRAPEMQPAAHGGRSIRRGSKRTGQ